MCPTGKCAARSSLTVVARGCLHSQAIPTLLHSSLICVAQAPSGGPCESYPLGLNVSSDPLPGALRPGLRRLSGEEGETCLSINGLPSSMTAFASAWPGLARSVRTRSIAAVEPEKMAQSRLCQRISMRRGIEPSRVSRTARNLFWASPLSGCSWVPTAAADGLSESKPLPLPLLAPQSQIHPRKPGPPPLSLQLPCPGRSASRSTSAFLPPPCSEARSPPQPPCQLCLSPPGTPPPRPGQESLRKSYLCMCVIFYLLSRYRDSGGGLSYMYPFLS